MPLDAVANFVRGLTDAAVDNAQTTVSVEDASIFPDPSTDGEYNVVIWAVDSYPRPDQDPNVEILRVTATDTTGDNLTVTRAQEGTIAASHPTQSAVHLSPTAKMFSDIEDELANSGLQDGENFDGQGTSDFSNLQSINTEKIAISDNIHVATDSTELKSLIDADQRIYLLPKTYSVNDIDASCTIKGIYPYRAATPNGCSLKADTASQITVSSRASIKETQFIDDVSVTTDFGTSFDDCVFNGSITFVGTNRASVMGCGEGSITLDSNTAKCSVVGCTNVSITNNGTDNEVIGNTRF